MCVTKLNSLRTGRTIALSGNTFSVDMMLVPFYSIW